MLRTNPDQRYDGLENTYDLIIIGGGIHGATLLWEVTLRGLSAILLEKVDFGSGTSSNSLKMIHGGMRYLQSLDIRRLRESSAERRALMEIAPHLVSPMQCVMPTYRGVFKSKFVLKIGMIVYDLLTKDRNRGLDHQHRINPGRIFSQTEFQNMLPFIEDPDITGGAEWFDGQVYNSERLILAFIMSAIGQGGQACNYTALQSVLEKDGCVSGVRARDSFTGKEIELHSNVVVDCRGPWSAIDPLYKNAARSQKMPKLVRAMNLVVGRQMADFAVGARTRKGGKDSAGRLMFIAPWRTGSIVGTWYFPDNCVPGYRNIDAKEMEECIEEINRIFPSYALEIGDITNVHMGMLPAMPGPDCRMKNTELLSRPAVIDMQKYGGPKGLICVQGVKYTTARHVARSTLAVLIKNKMLVAGKSNTDNMPLYGGAIHDIQKYVDECVRRYDKHTGIHTIKRLIKNYGTCIDSIMQYVERDPALGSAIPGSKNHIKAELEYILNAEMAYTLSDLLLRRTDIGSLSRPDAETIEYCSARLAEHWGWDEADKKENVAELLGYYPNLV